MRHLVWFGLLAVSPLSAQAPASDLSVTIYNSNLALVQDKRQIANPAGRSRQEFPNVSG